MPSSEEKKKEREKQAYFARAFYAMIRQFHAIISESICSRFGNFCFNVDE